jgi:hypothetical protein
MQTQKERVSSAATGFLAVVDSAVKLPNLNQISSSKLRPHFDVARINEEDVDHTLELYLFSVSHAPLSKVPIVGHELGTTKKFSARPDEP